MKDKFNRYCAEVIGINVSKEIIPKNGLATELRICHDGGCLYKTYRPYDDLNQSIPVAQALILKLNRNLLLTVCDGDIQQQINAFIISAMPESLK